MHRTSDKQAVSSSVAVEQAVSSSVAVEQAVLLSFSAKRVYQFLYSSFSRLPAYLVQQKLSTKGP